jgi:hypothetical protein
MEFKLVETTIDQIHAAYRSGELTCRQLVEMYLARINDFDKAGPEINSIITVNPNALVDADRLDAVHAAGGFVGPLHGIPVVVKDQCDALPMPTTLGSLLFKDNYPDRDAFVVEKCVNTFISYPNNMPNTRKFDYNKAAFNFFVLRVKIECSGSNATLSPSVWLQLMDIKSGWGPGYDIHDELTCYGTKGKPHHRVACRNNDVLQIQLSDVR